MAKNLTACYLSFVTQVFALINVLFIAAAAGCSPSAAPNAGAAKVASSLPPPPPPAPATPVLAPSNGGQSSPAASLPSLRDITAIYFTELPGIDLPMEPQRPASLNSLDPREVNQLHENPQVVSLLKGYERLYETSDGRCEVWLPGAVVLQLPLRAKPEGFTRDYYIKTADEYAIYELAESTLGEGRDERASIKKVVDAFTANWKAMDGQVIYRRDVAVNGLKGEETMISAETDEKQVMIVRSFCADGVIYALTETAKPRDKLTPLGEKFFNSFRRRGGQ